MAQKKVYSRSYRVRKAYSTALRVVASYAWLGLRSWVLGSGYYQKRIVGLHLKNAEYVKQSILKLEGLFIKVGQLLSILSNFLPPAFHEPLEALQDQLPPRPYSEIESRIKKELGQSPKALFQRFDQLPLASASIGQAHRAALKDGTEVVVKVQHYNIEQVAAIDLGIMEQLTRILSWWYRIKGLKYAYTQVKKMIEEELDFLQEARAMELIRQNLREEGGLKIPRVHHEFSTTRILTTTYCEGVKISQTTRLDEWGIDKQELGLRLIHAYCQMVFVDGVYHADPHPGNILIQRDGTIVLLDFGAVGSLQPTMREGFLKLIEAAAKNDTEKIIDALQLLGFIAQDRNAEKIAEKVIAAFRKFLENEVEFDGLNFKDLKVNPFRTSLFHLLAEIGVQGITKTVQVPKDYVMLNRMVTLLLGICNTLDPQINPLEVLRPYFQQYVLGDRGDRVQLAKDFIQRSAITLLTIPGDLAEVLNKARRGKLELQLVGETEKSLLFYALGQQLLYALLTICALGFSYWFYLTDHEHWSRWGLLAAGLFGLLFLRAWRRGRKIQKIL